MSPHRNTPAHNASMNTIVRFQNFTNAVSMLLRYYCYTNRKFVILFSERLLDDYSTVQY